MRSSVGIDREDMRTEKEREARRRYKKRKRLKVKSTWSLFHCGYCKRTVERQRKNVKTCGQTKCVKRHRQKLKLEYARQRRAAGLLYPSQIQSLKNRQKEKDKPNECRHCSKLILKPTQLCNTCRKLKRWMGKSWPILHCQYCGKIIKLSRQGKCRNNCNESECLRKAQNEKVKRWSIRHPEVRRMPEARLNANMRAAVGRALNKKDVNTFILLGYTAKQLRNHLENQFEFGMSWETYGKHGWEVDHIKPLSWFKTSGQRNIQWQKMWRLNNLQPRWATTKIAKCYGGFQVGNANKSNHWMG